MIATIDEKIDNVLTLTAGSAGASALISAIPGDAGSPIAEKLMDLSTGFLIVLAALFLEKYPHRHLQRCCAGARDAARVPRRDCVHLGVRSLRAGRPCRCASVSNSP
ncbi:MAG: hypothetical protein ACLTSX_09255 [Collinsella sp.]